jgi:DUF1016 N-terminal domain
MAKKQTTRSRQTANLASYRSIFGNVAELIEAARRLSVRSVNTVMTATYWAIGQQIVEAEQHGQTRARYGDALR